MTSFGKVTYVDSEKVNVTGVPGAFEEDDIIPDGLVKGDYVAVYKDSFTGNDKLVKAEKVTGKVDATKGSGSTITDVEIDGNWYTLGNKNANEPFQNAVVAKGDSVNGTGDTLTLYVINGVDLPGHKGGRGSTDTAFVIRKTNSIDADAMSRCASCSRTVPRRPLPRKIPLRLTASATAIWLPTRWKALLMS